MEHNISQTECVNITFIASHLKVSYIATAVLISYISQKVYRCTLLTYEVNRNTNTEKRKSKNVDERDPPSLLTEKATRSNQKQARPSLSINSSKG